MKLNLIRESFKSEPYELISYGDIKVTAFRYKSGIEALKVQNPKGHFVILPFHGQQIWNFTFGGRDLTMKTTIKEPVYSDTYLGNYGGFLYHCGISAFGAPRPEDTHPQHGEIPNIEYNEAYIICDEDENGKYVTVGGVLDYDIAFVRKYLFNPECRLYENSSVIKINITLENMKNAPMEYMYLCHINFAPINGAKLVYSAKRDSEHIKVHKIVSPDLPKEAADKLKTYMDALEQHPELQDDVGADYQCYNPEICFAIKYESDKDGRAYTMQYKKGEGACYVSHPVAELPVGVRWISKTADEESMGMILPATSEHLGYLDSKRKGYVKTLGPREKLSFYMETGYLDDSSAAEVEKNIGNILNK